MPSGNTANGLRDAAVAKLVVLRGKRILIDTNFANGSFRRQLPGREAVNVNLAAIRARGWPGERLQFRLLVVRVIGESVEILALQGDGVRVV